MIDALRGAEVPAWANGAYSVKRHGVTIANCDAEPVQTPGCIQSHGALLVLRIADLTVLQVSDNSLQRLGHEPSALLGVPAEVVLGIEGAAHIARSLRDEPIERNPLYIFTLRATGSHPPLDVVLHTAHGLAIVELEPATSASDHSHPDYYALIKKAVGHLQHAATLRGRDGCDVLQAIRGRPALRSLPVVIVITSASPRDVRWCFERGANAYHLKPMPYLEHRRRLEQVFVYWLHLVQLPGAAAPV